MTSSSRFTFWQLVRGEDGRYRMRPHVTIYDGMIEINRYGT